MRERASSVDEHVVAFAPERHARGVAAVGRLEVAGVVDPDIVQDQNQLVRDADGVGRVFHQKRAGQPVANLRSRHHVRVIPEEARIGHDEVVGE